MDIRVDFNFPQGNGNQWWSTSIPIDRGTLPQNYTLADLANAAKAIINTVGTTVTT